MGDEHAFRVLRPIQSTPKLLSLWIGNVCHVEEIQGILHWLSVLTAPASLTSFEWKAADGRPFQNHLAVDAFGPLFRFGNLCRLTIEGICALPFDNNTLRTIAQSFPHLEELNLNWVVGWRNPDITIHGLAHLFKGCRNLCQVELAVNATVVDPLPEELKGPRVQNTHIQHLNVSDSPINAPEAVANLLLALLADLRIVQDRSSAFG